MKNNMSTRTALLIGATGLTGGQLLHELLNNATYSKVVAIVRKPLTLHHPKLENLVVDFEKLDLYKEQIKADDVYCAIGTTIAKAGSQEAFRKVDFDYPLQIAKLALWNGARRFILVSSAGANPKSSIFYSRTKGELEEALKALKYEAVIILRPSILLGDRKEQRTGEAMGMFVAEKLSFLFAGPLKAYRGTPVDLLAKQMVKLGTGIGKGIRVVENIEIFELAGE